MPVVPFNKASGTQVPAQVLPPDQYLLMAAAQMNKEGRLVESDSPPPLNFQKMDDDIKRFWREQNMPSPAKRNPEEYPPSNGRQDTTSMMT